MTQAARALIVAVAVTFASILVVVTTAMAAVSLTDEVRVSALVILSTAIVASLLVVYFEWRTRTRRRIVDSRSARGNAA